MELKRITAYKVFRMNRYILGGSQPQNSSAIGHFILWSHPDTAPNGEWTFEFSRWATQDERAQKWAYDQICYLNNRRDNELGRME